jgi:hypothetical protein
MRKTLGMILAFVAVAALASFAFAEERTKIVKVEGKLACAHCTLKMADATECQDVLVVKGKEGAEPTYYYIVHNEVAKEFGHTCKGEKAVIVTGTLEEKDGKTWLAATKIEQPAA